MINEGWRRRPGLCISLPTLRRRGLYIRLGETGGKSEDGTCSLDGLVYVCGGLTGRDNHAGIKSSDDVRYHRNSDSGKHGEIVLGVWSL